MSQTALCQTGIILLEGLGMGMGKGRDLENEVAGSMQWLGSRARSLPQERQTHLEALIYLNIYDPIPVVPAVNHTIQ